MKDYEEDRKADTKNKEKTIQNGKENVKLSRIEGNTTLC